MQNKSIILFCVVIFTLISYLLYTQVATIRPHQDIDSKAYIENGKLFANNLSFAGRKTFPYYGLGYPAFVGLVYMVFGDNDIWVIIFQIILSLMSLMLIFLIAQRLFNTCVGLITAGLFSCNLGYLVFSQFILTEILLAVYLLVFFDYMSRYCLEAQQRFLIYAGGALGLSMFIKPAALYFIVPLLPLIFFIQKVSWMNGFKHIFMFFGAFAFPVLCIIGHNKIVFDQCRISALDDVNIYFWLYANVQAHERGTTSAAERLLLQKQYVKQGRESIRKNFWFDFKSKPLLFGYVWMKNVMKTMLGLYTSNLKILVEEDISESISFFSQTGSLYEKLYSYVTSGTKKKWVHLIGFLEAVFNLLRYIFCLVALLVLLSQRRWALSYLFTSYLAYFSMITGHDGCARFRMMFEFILVILMAYGFWWLITYCCYKKISYEKE